MSEIPENKIKRLWISKHSLQRFQAEKAPNGRIGDAAIQTGSPPKRDVRSNWDEYVLKPQTRKKHDRLR